MRAITIIRTELPCQTRPVEANCYLSHFCCLPILRREPPSRDNSPFARWRPRADQQRNRPKPRSSSAASTRMSRGRSTSSASATAHLTTIAPTATIALSADNVSSGLEPVCARSHNQTIQTFEGPRPYDLCMRERSSYWAMASSASTAWSGTFRPAAAMPNRRPRGEIATVELRVTGYQMQLRSQRNAAGMAI